MHPLHGLVIAKNLIFNGKFILFVYLPPAKTSRKKSTKLQNSRGCVTAKTACVGGCVCVYREIYFIFKLKNRQNLFL